MSFLVEQLEAAGYVERVPDTADRRARLGRLTAHADGVVTSAEVVSAADRSPTDEKRPFVRSDERQSTDEQGRR